MPKHPKPLGPNIREARKAAGLTQTELAERIGYNGTGRGSYICRVESGGQEPRLDTLSRIATALGVAVEKLLS